mmetsp:Transcript_19734/g.35238  ORF Transcript_19734/g.35238 Transcript_19734/m.35238 type:complete len:690 (-) Transcript_19734:241-2310(-)
MARRAISLLLLVAFAFPAFSITRAQRNESPESDRTASCADEGECDLDGGSAAELSPSQTVVTACVAEFAAPFVSRKQPSSSGVSNGQDVLPLSDFLEQFQGHDVDMLAAIASMKFPEADFKVRVLPSFPAALYAVRKKRCDVGVSSFTVTQHRRQCSEACAEPDEGQEINNDFACCLEFSDSYFTDGMTMMSRYSVEDTMTALVASFWTPSILQAVCILTVFLIISGHLVWFVERTKNRAQFQSSYLDGVDNGIWWSFVTMTTVGYGDKVPITIPGRIIACVWMITGVFMFGIFNGVIISVMSASSEAVNLSGPEDARLADSRVCTTSGSFEEYVSAHGLGGVSIFAQSLQECFDLLVAEEVDSVFYDRLALLEAIDTRRDTPAVRQLQKVSPGVEVGKSFQLVQFAAAMPINGTHNAALADAISRLNVGEAVYALGAAMKFGFTMRDNAMRWTDFNKELDATSQMKGSVSRDEWRVTSSWVAVSTAVTLLYICIQFGGLWVRRLRRYRMLRQSMRPDEGSQVSLRMVPYKEEHVEPNVAEGITEKVLERSGLHAAVAKMRADMSFVRRASVNLRHHSHPSGREGLASKIFGPIQRLSHMSHDMSRPSSHTEGSADNGRPRMTSIPSAQDSSAHVVSPSRTRTHAMCESAATRVSWGVEVEEDVQEVAENTAELGKVFHARSSRSVHPV